MRAAHAVLGGVVLSLMVPLGISAPSAGAQGHQAHKTSAHSSQDSDKSTSHRRGGGGGGGGGDGSKKWVPAKGAAFSNPLSPRHRILVAKVIRAINNTKKGEFIRIAVWNLDDWPSVGALIRAKQRGAKVQVVVAGSVQNPSYRRLATRLNRNKKDDSFARKCSGGCRSRTKIMHSKFFLFSKIHSAENVSMFGSSNMTTPAGNRQWNDLVTTYDKGLYNFLVTTFKQYAKDRSVKSPYTVHRTGRYRVTLYPARGRNPQLEELKKVRCQGTRGGTGNANHRTVLRFAVAGWFDDYGQRIADRVRQLWNQGCDIRIVTTLAGRGINQTFRNPRGRGPIPIRQVTVDRNADGIPEMYLHEKSLSISGRYAGDRSASVVFTGSPNWSTRAQRSEEIWVRIMNQPRLARKYNAHVNQLFFSSAAHARVSSPADLRMALNAPMLEGGAVGRTTTGKAKLPHWFELD